MQRKNCRTSSTLLRWRPRPIWPGSGKLSKDFIRATREGVRWALANPDKAAEISVAALPDLPHDETRNAIKDYVKRNFWKFAGVLPMKSLAATVDLMKESGQLTGAIAYEDFVATEFTKA